MQTSQILLNRVPEIRRNRSLSMCHSDTIENPPPLPVQLHPVHKYLCGKDVSTFFVPPLSQAEADKINSLRNQPWDHKCDTLCRCPKVEPPESTLFDLVRSLGLYEGEWK